MSDDTRDESVNDEARASDADGSAAVRPPAESEPTDNANPNGTPAQPDESAVNEPAVNEPAPESAAVEEDAAASAASPPASGLPENGAAEDNPAEQEEDTGAGAPESAAAEGEEEESAAATTEENSAEEDSAEEDNAAEGEAAEDATETEEEPSAMQWYILKVQNNREDSIRAALLRRMKIAELEDFFDEVIVPTETVSEYKNGKRRSRKKKIWPGYIIVHMEINEDTWFLVRETPGIGDFTGAGGKPTPMEPEEVAKVLALVRPDESKGAKEAPVVIGFNVGDKVKIKDGTFQNFEGEVEAVNSASGRVTVMTTIFGRPTPVELEYWQIESV